MEQWQQQKDTCDRIHGTSLVRMQSSYALPVERRDTHDHRDFLRVLLPYILENAGK